MSTECPMCVDHADGICGLGPIKKVHIIYSVQFILLLCAHCHQTVQQELCSTLIITYTKNKKYPSPHLIHPNTYTQPSTILSGWTILTFTSIWVSAAHCKMHIRTIHLSVPHFLILFYSCEADIVAYPYLILFDGYDSILWLNYCNCTNSATI